MFPASLPNIGKVTLILKPVSIPTPLISLPILSILLPLILRMSIVPILICYGSPNACHRTLHSMSPMEVHLILYCSLAIYSLAMNT